MSNTPTATRRFRLHLLPQTPPGWWSGRLFLAAITLFIATILLVNVAGQRGLWIAFTMIPAGVAAVLGGITAAVAVFRFRERGALVLISLLVGVAVVWFLIGEVTTPH